MGRHRSEKAMAPHSSTLAWKIPWKEEPGGLQSMGSQRVGHDWATSLSLSLSCIGEGNGNPLQCSCLENPRDGGAWWAAIYGVAQSRTRLKRLSSSSSRHRVPGCWISQLTLKSHASLQKNISRIKKIFLQRLFIQDDSYLLFLPKLTFLFLSTQSLFPMTKW